MTDATPPATPLPSLTSRFVGILFSPGETYAAALKNPSPYGILFLATVVIAIGSAAPQFSPTVQQAVVDMQLAASPNPTPETRQTLETFAGYSPYISLVATFIFVPISVLIVTGLFWGIFNALLGGTASFKDVMTVVSYGMVIAAVGVLLSAPIILIQGQIQTAGPFNLGALVPMMDSSSFIYRYLSSISVFTLWQTIVVSIGLGVLYRKSGTSIAIGLLITYLIVAAAVVAVFGRFTGS